MSALKEQPYRIFDAWYSEATKSEPRVPDAMQLSTVDDAGRPACRTVLLKGVDERGLVFFTNLRSRKAAHLSGSPHAALLFHWKSLERQVHVEGRVESVSAEEADTYFATRARGSQIGAWASQQSAERIAGRLEAKLLDVTQRFAGEDVPRPPFWSGFRVVPERWEFWQGRPDRLHDRLVFTWNGQRWLSVRLDP